MDIFIVTNALLDFVLFYGIHVLTFRHTDPKKIFQSPFIVYRIGLVASIAVYAGLVQWMYSDYALFPLSVHVVAYCVALLLYSFLVALYVFGMFGMILESSLRIRLLSLVAHAGEKGIDDRQILKIYNTDTILRKRIDRLMTSGVLECTRGQYRIKKSFSILLFHGTIVNVLNRLYRKQRKRAVKMPV